LEWSSGVELWRRRKGVTSVTLSVTDNHMYAASSGAKLKLQLPASSVKL
jgi:hypothetical protein